MLKKILDLNKLSYNQLKNLLIFSVACIGAVYFVGQKTNDFKHTIDKTYDMTVQNTEAIDKLNSRFSEIELKNKQNYMNFYSDMVKLNEQNNKLMDNKFMLLIKYGDKNKNLLMELIEMENEKQRSNNEALLIKQNYNPSPQYTDTLVYSVGVKKKGF